MKKDESLIRKLQLKIMEIAQTEGVSKENFAIDERLKDVLQKVNLKEHSEKKEGKGKKTKTTEAKSENKESDVSDKSKHSVGVNLEELNFSMKELDNYMAEVIDSDKKDKTKSVSQRDMQKKQMEYVTEKVKNTIPGRRVDNKSKIDKKRPIHTSKNDKTKNADISR